MTVLRISGLDRLNLLAVHSRVVRWLVVNIGICTFLLMAPHSLLAQHRGQGGGGASGRPAGAANSDDLQDFKRTLALQASPDQIAQFRELTKTTEAAKKSAQDILQMASKGDKPGLIRNLDDLTIAVAQAQRDNERYLATLSAAQKSLLKDLTKKIGKANSEITKLNKTLDRTRDQKEADAKQVAGVLEKLGEALNDLGTNQSAIGHEMSIQPEGNSQKQATAQ